MRYRTADQLGRVLQNFGAEMGESSPVIEPTDPGDAIPMNSILDQPATAIERKDKSGY